MNDNKHYIIVIYENMEKEIVKEVKHFDYCTPVAPLAYVNEHYLKPEEYRIFKEVYIDVTEEDA